MAAPPEPVTVPSSSPPLSPPADAPPAARPRRTLRAPITRCLNCDAPVSGHYCSHCGQETHDQSVALGTLASEMASELASFDSKLVRTVLPLLLRPGFLTNEFNLGRRVRYLSPLKMYLVISALFFLALSRLAPVQHMNLGHISDRPAQTKLRQAAYQSASAQISTEITQAKTPQDRAALKQAQAKLATALGQASPASKPAKPPNSLHVTLGPSDIATDTLPATVALYDARQAALPPPRRDTGIKRFLIRRVIKTNQSPQELAQGFVDDLPRMMFVLLPAFALLLRVTYWRTKRLYVSHLIFALHTHAFVFLLLTAALLLPSALHGPALGISAALTAAYLLAALKVVYRQAWGRTLLAFGWLGFNYLFLLTSAFLLTLGAAFLLA